MIVIRILAAMIGLMLTTLAHAESLATRVPIPRGESIVLPKNGAEHTFMERLAIVSGIAGAWNDTCAKLWRAPGKDEDVDHPALAAVADEVKALKKSGQLSKNFYELASTQYLNATSRTDTCSWIGRHFPVIVRYSAVKPVDPLVASYRDARNDECKDTDLLCRLTQIELEVLLLYALVIFVMCWVLMRYGIELLSWNMRQKGQR